MKQVPAPQLRGQCHMILGGLVAVVCMTQLTRSLFMSGPEGPTQTYLAESRSGKVWPPRVANEAYAPDQPVSEVTSQISESSGKPRTEIFQRGLGGKNGYLPIAVD